MQERVNKFMNGDWLIIGKAFFEIITFQHTGNGVVARQTNHAFGAQFTQPVGVEYDAGFLRIQNFVDLLFVGFRIA